MQTDAAEKIKLAAWSERFKTYRLPPTEDALKAWLAQFSKADRAVAEKVLDQVHLVTEEEIHRGYKAALGAIPGWDRVSANRTGRFFFIGFGKPGESGAAMLRIFREANNLASSTFDDLFVSLSDLPNALLTDDDTVVFVDDFAGTGTQVLKYWPRIQEILGSHPHCHLVLTAVTTGAQTLISEQTGLQVSAKFVLGPDKNIFDADCSLFSEPEKTTLLHYGKKADNSKPKGHGDCGLLFVLHHKTPNNTVPILHVNSRKWKGVFPRYLKVA